MSIVEYDAFYATVSFIQLREFGFTQFGPGRSCALDQCRNDAPALRVTRFQFKNAVSVRFAAPRCKSLAQLRGIHSLHLCHPTLQHFETLVFEIARWPFLSTNEHDAGCVL